jgi:hypothetical protein
MACHTSNTTALLVIYNCERNKPPEYQPAEMRRQFFPSVVHLVEALRYKPEGREFDWNFY